ncbi:hypothetical protein PPACK8108_LOCUS19781 [Phakopsora pachyrhizi]|uniref:Uncharacterized protein n=1 Tax=Phakopsora pachyrhizi TaxID=170000 RepID=A0AAV0BEC8_PHAPC|nr:hypothetical protein PPACK8108_LOCUS19781 [Phakopsora pachyrhizi]
MACAGVGELQGRLTRALGQVSLLWGWWACAGVVELQGRLARAGWWACPVVGELQGRLPVRANAQINIKKRTKNKKLTLCLVKVAFGWWWPKNKLLLLFALGNWIGSLDGRMACAGVGKLQGRLAIWSSKDDKDRCRLRLKQCGCVGVNFILSM